MPYYTEHVAPDVYFRHQDVDIYHTYKEEDADLPRVFWFTTDQNEDPQFEFDIRTLAATLVKKGLLASFVEQEDKDAFHTVLRTAIENKLLSMSAGGLKGTRHGRVKTDHLRVGPGVGLDYFASPFASSVVLFESR